MKISDVEYDGSMFEFVLASVSLFVLVITNQVLDIFIIGFVAHIKGKLHIVKQKFSLKRIEFFSLKTSNLCVVTVLIIKVIIEFACYYKTCQNNSKKGIRYKSTKCQRLPKYIERIKIEIFTKFTSFIQIN